MTNDPNMPDWRLRELARQAAKEAVHDLTERLGIDDIGQTRRNLDFLDTRARAAENRRSEVLKTVFGLLGGLALGFLSYLAATVLKGHAP